MEGGARSERVCCRVEGVDCAKEGGTKTEDEMGLGAVGGNGWKERRCLTGRFGRMRLTAGKPLMVSTLFSMNICSRGVSTDRGPLTAAASWFSDLAGMLLKIAWCSGNEA